jgi:hypothetical protein
MKCGIQTKTKLALALGIFCAWCLNVTAGNIALFEYAFNVDGTIYNGSIPGGVSGSSFDINAGPQTFTTVINGPGTKYFGLFVDYEIDQSLNTFFNEYGTPYNSPLAEQSWEIDEPGYRFGDIYDHFQNSYYGNSLLENDNGVPSATPDDVSMAIAWELDLTASQIATISFILSPTAPTTTTSFLYLEQTDPGQKAPSPTSLYFWSESIVDQTPGVPDGGSTFTLLALTLAGLGGLRRKL